MKTLTLLVLLFTSCLAAAGSRGYTVAFVDISASGMADGMDVMYALRKSTKIDGRTACWACEKRYVEAGIAILFLKRLPAGVNAATVTDAVTKNGAPLAALQKNMRDFTDTDGARLDGLYAYERSPSAVTLYAISPRNGSRTSKLTQPVREKIRPAQLDAMLEKLAASFPFVP